MIPAPYPHKFPKAVLFDWDNTLVDTWQVAFKALNTALQGIGRIPLTLDEFFQRPHYSIRDAALELFGEHAKQGEHAYYASVKKFHLQELSMLQGADILLEDLSSRGIYMGIVSNKEGHYLRKEVDHLGWQPYFHQVIGARDTEEDKPSSLPVLDALQHSTILPSHEVWFVGDSLVDVQCARASGCIPIIVGQGEASHQANIIHVKDCQGLVHLMASL